MIAELALRFLLGGLIVSAFSLTGELWKPKSFSGLFGAAPSVALASLALAFGKHGPGEVALLARSMVVGALALYAYGTACVFTTRRARWPVWISALSAWLAWFAAAFAGLAAVGGLAR